MNKAYLIYMSVNDDELKYDRCGKELAKKIDAWIYWLDKQLPNGVGIELATVRDGDTRNTDFYLKLTINLEEMILAGGLTGGKEYCILQNESIFKK